MRLVEKYLTEGGNRNNFEAFADNVIRLIIGDKEDALKALKGLEFDLAVQNLEPGDYNKVYTQLYKAIHQPLKKEVASVYKKYFSG